MRAMIYRRPEGSMLAGVVAILTLALGLLPVGAAVSTLYSTRFEQSEGFDPAYYLGGQNGWVQYGSGGNGLTDYYEGLAQSAYIGHAPLTTTNGLYLWYPVNFGTTNRPYNITNCPIITFSVDMLVTDSTNGFYDEFRWSVYNTNGTRLFSLIFDNYDFGIYYQLNDAGGPYHDTGRGFYNDALYDIQIKMNFASNYWNAWVAGVHVVTNAPVTMTSAARTLGEVEAVWLPVGTNVGNNFMVFDNYSITADVLPWTIPVVEPPVFLAPDQHSIRVLGQPGMRYAVETSTNLTGWTSLRTNIMSASGYFHYTNGTGTLPRRYYRARWIP